MFSDDKLAFTVMKILSTGNTFVFKIKSRFSAE